MQALHLAVAAAAALSIPLGAPAQDPIPLGFGIPADTHVFIHGRTPAQLDPGSAGLARALDHLVGSRIHEDILELIALAGSRREAEQIRALGTQAFAILGRADWATLFGTEIAFAERIQLPIPEYLLLCRVPAGQGGAQLEGLRSMFDGLVELAGGGDLRVREASYRFGELRVLEIEGAPVQLAAGATADVIVLSTSTRTTVAAMRGLSGDGSSSIATKADFTGACARLGADPADAAYVDFAGLTAFVGQLIGLAEIGAGEDRDARIALRLAATVLDELDIVDHMVATTRTDGAGLVHEALIRMRPGHERSRLVQLGEGQQPWTDWQRLVPVDATSFAFETGVDVGRAFDLVEELAAEALGEDAPWTGMPLYREIRQKAGHLSGEFAQVGFPADGGGQEQVLALRLERTEGVADWIGAQLRQLAGLLASRGQTMTVDSEGGMHRIGLAAFPRLRPVLGVRGELFLIASSPEALARIEQVRQGLAPDIRQNPRFAALGIGAGPAAESVAYAQLETGMGALADLVGAAGFFFSLLPEDRETRPMIRLGAVLTKLAPALRELDLAYDQGSEMRAGEEPGTYHSRSVVRYRDARR
jgi:hypothetical protein